MTLRFVWKRKIGQYQTGGNLYLGKIRVAGYSYSMIPGTKWSGIIHLPSLKESELYTQSEEEMKKQIEDMVTMWFDEATK